ncbi:MAG: carbamoyl-phosphate synthase large subunit [Bdellovibrionota bacterium]
MPRRQDIKKILILGSGPIVIGQAAEFDYSGTQACKALMEEGYEVVLINSNPATIMTDPEMAHKVYIEPLRPDFVEKVIAKERPDAIIPTLGGQTALNLALDLHRLGVLEKYNCELLAASPQVIKTAEDRELFREVLDKVGAKYPKSYMVRTFEHGLTAADELGYPLILRPNYTLGGGGGGIAFSPEDYRTMLAQALNESPTSEVLVEESILGWKEYELEVMQDAKGTFVVICSIENLDPCGVHTGDSITVAPQQTLTDQEYQAMRDEAQKIIHEVGVQTGGANIQFAVHPTTQERVVIEMNPRVSRSSALASKATGFPIAKLAALLAVGYHLDEILNDITKSTPSCYEPALDYVVTKIPRFAFEKFHTRDYLTTQMKSVGEVMGIGRTLQESLMKALASMEGDAQAIPEVIMTIDHLSYPNSKRIYHLFQAFRDGKTIPEIQDLTQIDPWFLEQISEIVQFEKQIKTLFAADPANALRQAKKKGFTDARIAKLLGKRTEEILALRESNKVTPVFFQVDTCAGEFKSETPYFYSTYWSQYQQDIKLPVNPVMVIGSGPNRIGQGIEFDYSCVRGVKAFRKAGVPVVMVNSNPETVSTDYDTANVLFFEPLTSEHVFEVCRWVKPRGFVAQLGGQTPINIAQGLVKHNVPLLGSSLETIDLAEDRGRFAQVCRDLKLDIPISVMSGGIDDALKADQKIGYPMICRPSYVLGGRRMEVIDSREELTSYFQRHKDFISPSHPCMMDQFLDGALECDVDLVRGPDWIIVGGIIEHIEAAGVHSGDSMGVLPPQRLKPETERMIEDMCCRLADRIGIIGHLNLQLAIKDDKIFVLEANPRSSRTVPFIVKASGIPLVDLAVEAMLGRKKADLNLAPLHWRNLDCVSVKGVVFPFKKFPESDAILGPEMKSTGETMGRGRDYGEALLKAFISSQIQLPARGEVFLSLREKDKTVLLPFVKELHKMGFELSATTGTAQYLQDEGLPCLSLRKVHEGRPHCVDRIRSGSICFVINTTKGRQSIEASFDIRRACTDYSIPCITESDTAEAFAVALNKFFSHDIGVSPLNKLYSY